MTQLASARHVVFSENLFYLCVMRLKKLAIYTLMGCVLTATLPACKAKSCDVDNNVADGKSSRKKKNMGLFSKKEMRRKRW